MGHSETSDQREAALLDIFLQWSVGSPNNNPIDNGYRSKKRKLDWPVDHGTNNILKLFEKTRLKTCAAMSFKIFVWGT